MANNKVRVVSYNDLTTLVQIGEVDLLLTHATLEELVQKSTEALTQQNSATPNKDPRTKSLRKAQYVTV